MTKLLKYAIITFILKEDISMGKTVPEHLHTSARVLTWVPRAEVLNLLFLLGLFVGLVGEIWFLADFDHALLDRAKLTGIIAVPIGNISFGLILVLVAYYNFQNNKRPAPYVGHAMLGFVTGCLLAALVGWPDMVPIYGAVGKVCALLVYGAIFPEWARILNPRRKPQ